MIHIALHTVMILDDEAWIVRGLVEMVDWEALGFVITGQFYDSEQALHCIRETEPNLVLLDIRMPKLTGDMLMEMIREEGIPTEFIILSGYSDFSVAQKAIRHGAYGYLLKPLKKEELIAALQRVKRTFDERDQSEKRIPIDPMSYTAFYQRAWKGSKIQIEDGRKYQLILTDGDCDNGIPVVESAVISRPVNIYGGRMLYMAIANESIAPCDLNHLKRWSQEKRCALGLSQVGSSMKEYHKMFQQANCALCGAYLQEKSGCYLYSPPNLVEVDRWLDILRTLYEEQDSKNLRWELSRIVDQWKFRGNPASVLMFISQLTYSVISGKELRRTEMDFNLEKFLYGDISSKFSNITEILDFLIKLLDTDRLRQEELAQIPNAVFQMKEYLYQHYNEELNLNRISREFFLSPAYICEIFKKFTGCTITGYLLQIRMEKACNLLLETDLSLADISAQVGYSDYNYFCRLFKRYFNMSPTTYRREKKWAL